MKKIALILLGLVASSTLGWACGPSSPVVVYRTPSTYISWYSGPTRYAPISCRTAPVVYVRGLRYCAPAPEVYSSWSLSSRGHHHGGRHHR
jgi:hypothetical protein